MNYSSLVRIFLILQLSIYLIPSGQTPPPPTGYYPLPPPPPPPSPKSCFETQTCPGENFIKIGPTNPKKFISVILWTRQNGFASVCPTLVAQISDPCNEKYGNYYSLEQIKRLTYNQQDIVTITQYLERNGVTGCNITASPNGDYIVINVTVATSQRLFSNQYFDYKSLKTGNIYTASIGYTIPSGLQGAVTYPMAHPGGSCPTPPPPTNNTLSGGPAPSVLKRDGQAIHITQTTSDSSPYYTTPGLVRKTYNFSNKNLTYSPDSARQAVMGACGQSFSPNDLKAWRSFNKYSDNPVWNVTGLNDPTSCPHDYCFEGNLDTQYINTFIPDAKTWFWSVENNPFYSPFLNLAAQVNADPNPPDVFSISYANAEKLMDPLEVMQFNNEACKMALRGITVIVSSGDYGAPGLEGCLVNTTNCTINPLFPAACPYVTSVGATLGPEMSQNEVAASLKTGSVITSGGGFSSIFSRPQWQNNAVKRYLNNYNNVPNAKFFSKNRAYPDVSFMSNNFLVYLNAGQFLFSGTSASAPAFASLITLANSVRASNRKPKLGFLNPLLYNKLLENAYNDITEGSNDCCSKIDSNFCCPGNGFDASPGWDPVTGLGTLDAQKFINVVGNYPNRIQSTPPPQMDH